MSEEFSSPGSLQPSINPVKSLVSWGILGQSTAMIYFNLRAMNREEWVAPIPGDRLSVLHGLVSQGFFTSRPFLKTAGGIVLGSVAVSAVSADVLPYISVAIKASFLKLGMCNICKNNIAKMFLDF